LDVIENGSWTNKLSSTHQLVLDEQGENSLYSLALHVGAPLLDNWSGNERSAWGRRFIGIGPHVTRPLAAKDYVVSLRGSGKVEPVAGR